MNVAYDDSVDSWGIGIITYLILAGYLPFDHETDESEIARMTIQDPANFSGRAWKKISNDAIHFVQSKHNNNNFNF